jgi:hypothetical protein
LNILKSVEMFSVKVIFHVVLVFGGELAHGALLKDFLGYRVHRLEVVLKGALVFSLESADRTGEDRGTGVVLGVQVLENGTPPDCPVPAEKALQSDPVFGQPPVLTFLRFETCKILLIQTLHY